MRRGNPREILFSPIWMSICMIGSSDLFDCDTCGFIGPAPRGIIFVQVGNDAHHFPWVVSQSRLGHLTLIFKPRMDANGRESEL